MNKPVVKAAPPAKVKPVRNLGPADQSVTKAFRTLLMMLILTSAVAAFVVSSERKDILFKTDSAGRLEPLQSMDSPNVGSDAVINWAKLAISEVFTYNFNNVYQRLDGASRYFTPQGWSSFVASIQKQELLTLVTSQRQFVTTIPTTAVISSEFEEKGHYYWMVQVMTLRSVYTGVSTTSSIGLTLKIEQIPSRDSWAGYVFGITQISY